MCGIIGYVGPRESVEVLIEGLRRLEYRGYDSAGVVVQNGDGSRVVRSLGKLDRLDALIRSDPPRGHIGIGHTRWATHGRPSENNAHPHKYGRIAVVHNGIIENHADLRRGLVAAGHVFASDTDSEVIAHLIDDELRQTEDPLEATRRALDALQGIYGLAVLADGFPDRLICARKDLSMVVGTGDDEGFVGSDIPSIAPYTQNILILDDDEVVEVRRDGLRVIDRGGRPLVREPRRITWVGGVAQKDGYRHFMHKEIHEQPRAVADTLEGRVFEDRDEIVLDGIDLDPARIGRVVLVACGTSHHACLVAKFLIEKAARISTEVDLASEFRYRDPLVGPGDLVVVVSQSGETADTLAALREARRRGARVLSIVNVPKSSMARESDATLMTRAGLEIGVASTKAFTAQLAALELIALHLGRRSGRLSAEALRDHAAGLLGLPRLMQDVLDLDPHARDIARRFVGARDWLFLGRGVNYPIALEGALKLKEISYVHAEGYPAGEMKHGPIALVDEHVPVVVLAPRGPGYEKVMSNLEEVRSRSGPVIAVATRDDRDVRAAADASLLIPDVPAYLQPLLTVLPLQLLAYHVADLRGTDVDQPRNLAKSVTVE